MHSDVMMYKVPSISLGANQGVSMATVTAAMITIMVLL